MQLQYLCHPLKRWVRSSLFCCIATLAAAPALGAEAPVHDYPTIARVEYVNECMVKSGGKLAALYQCSCAIDRIAAALTYDDFVEASTFAKYAALPGQGGAIFRDSDRARTLAKSFRTLEADSLRGCGLSS
jgi:hypothetical protein